MINCFTRLKIILPALLSVIYTLSYSQTGTLAGTVLDSKKEPVTGATVRVEGTTLGAATDIDGKYTIANVPTGKHKIDVSYIGMQPQTIAVTVKEGETLVTDVTMKDNDELLNEVVVVGYGTQIKKDMSSSVSEVKGDVVGDKPVYDFTSALQGQAAGVQITTDNGLAGAATTVRIRGTKSLTNSAEPLYIIDGVPIISYDISNAEGADGYNVSPLQNINPGDIANIVILKDAEATAIYGARGANGVIIVTTKQGSAGKTKVDFSFQTGMSQAAHVVSLLDAQQFIQVYNQAYHNDYPNFKGQAPLPGSLTDSTASNTNWLKQMLRTGHYEDASFSMSGGDAKTTYYIGMGFRDDESFMVGNAFERANFRSNLSHQVNKYFSVGYNASITYTLNKYVPASTAGGLGAAESFALPIFPVYKSTTDNFGNYYYIQNPSVTGTNAQANQNPVANIALNQSEGNTFSSVSNAYMEVTPFTGLTFRNEFGIDMINQLENFFTSPLILGGDSGVAADRRDFYFTWNLNSTLDYKKDIDNNNSIDALVGFNPTETTEKFSYISETDFPVSTFTQPQQGAIVNSATAGTGRQYAFVSYFTRINYKLYQRFNFEVSLRDDGSSRFDQGHRWGLFPAGSAAWMLTDEHFMNRATKVLSLFKLRASVGATGNSEMTTDWAFLSAYSGGQNYAGLTGIGPSNLPVPNLTWETTIKSDVGFDYGFLNNRLSGVVDFYEENTHNCLISTFPLSPSSGFSSTTANVGALYNRGIEFNITTNNLKAHSKLQWKTTLNIATNQNKVTNLGGVYSIGGTNYGNNAAVVGYPVGVWLLAQYAGIDPQTGQVLIYDSTGKNKVVANATNTVEYEKPVGRPYPILQGGLTNTFKFYNFDVLVLFTFSVGNQIYDDDGKRQTGNINFGWNQLSEVEDAWTAPGQVTSIQKLTTLSTPDYDINTTRYLYNASFLRLRTLTLGYTLPARSVAKMKMRTLRFYISAQNLAVLTKYNGWDPETNRDNSGAITQGVSYLNTPQARIYSIGFNVGF